VFTALRVRARLAQTSVVIAFHILSLSKRLHRKAPEARARALRSTSAAVAAYADQKERQSFLEEVMPIPSYAEQCSRDAVEVLDILARIEEGLAQSVAEYGEPMNRFDYEWRPLSEPFSGKARPVLDRLVRADDPAERAELVMVFRSELDQYPFNFTIADGLSFLSVVAYAYYRLAGVPRARARDLTTAAKADAGQHEAAPADRTEPYAEWGEPAVAVDNEPRPVVLWDVDGVLNPRVPTPAHVGYRYEGPDETGEYVTYTFYLDPRHADWMAELTAAGADHAWATMWGEQAATLIAPRLGYAPASAWPVIAVGAPGGPRAVLPITEFLGDRPVFWLDDLVDATDLRWAAERTAHGVPTTIREITSTGGLGRADIDAALEWLAAMQARRS
jgi:hypothetical protein